MKPREQVVEGDEAGFAGEDAIERGFEISLALGRIGRKVEVGAVDRPLCAGALEARQSCPRHSGRQ
jgi:hypothetical protein